MRAVRMWDKMTRGSVNTTFCPFCDWEKNFCFWVVSRKKVEPGAIGAKIHGFCDWTCANFCCFTTESTERQTNAKPRSDRDGDTRNKQRPGRTRRPRKE